ncbi:hypothetical protein Tco_0457263, partial [Tanacetum coccineum]
EDEDDDMDIEADEEDEDDEMDVVALPTTAPSAEETEPFETDESAATPPPHPAYRMTAKTFDLVLYNLGSGTNL